MKNKFNILLCGIAALLMGITSCTDYLDKSPDAIIGEDEAFKNFKNFQGFVEEMYNLGPDVMRHFWVSSFNWGEDEILTLNEADYMFGHSVDRGTYRDAFLGDSRAKQSNYLYRVEANTEQARFGKNIWSSHWYGIRKCNMAFEALENGLMTDASQAERDMIKGQLHFMRAWFYFNITTYWGGMPYIDYAIPSNETNFDLPRETYQENADKMAADFKAAAELLPVDWDDTEIGRRTDGNNELRANKIWALAYLGKTYLYAASPLMEQGVNGKSTVNFGSNGEIQSINMGYNKEYAKKAADVLGEVLTMVENGETQYKLVPFEKYSDLFYTHKQNWLMPGSTEAIVRSPQYDNGDSFWRQSNSYQINDMASGDGITLCPTANYVNYYGMANGMPLNDPDSGFDKTHPWKDRDPRFYHDIVYDGIKMVDITDEKDPLSIELQYADLGNGGKYVASQDHHSRTGYLNYKFIPLHSNRWDKVHDGWGNALYLKLSWLRLAEVYLFYAEAAAQGYSGAGNAKSPKFSKTAAEAINVVRDRAGVGHVADKYINNLEDFMDEVRRERAVELAYEAHRFNDLRRWLLLTREPYNVKTAIYFERDGEFDPLAEPSERKVKGWKEEVLIQRNLGTKHYWMPFKTEDVTMYPEFYQNPGW